MYFFVAYVISPLIYILQGFEPIDLGKRDLFVGSPLYSSDTIPEVKIVRKLISYTAERRKLSLEYLEKRHGLLQSSPVIKPAIIVLHYTAGGTVNSVYNYFNQLYIEGKRKVNQVQSSLNVSAHFLVDRDGTIYQLIEDTLFSRHTIGLNYCAIGVENIGSNDQPLTPAQVIANAGLIRLLAKKFPIKYVIGHSEYGVFRKSALWKEKDPAYFTQKQDPGVSFMQGVRKQIQDLGLKGRPE